MGEVRPSPYKADVLASADSVSAAGHVHCQEVKRVERFTLENKETEQCEIRVHTAKMTRTRQILLSSREEKTDVFSNSNLKAQKDAQEKKRGSEIMMIFCR